MQTLHSDQAGHYSPVLGDAAQTLSNEGGGAQAAEQQLLERIRGIHGDRWAGPIQDAFGRDC